MRLSLTWNEHILGMMIWQVQHCITTAGNAVALSDLVQSTASKGYLRLKCLLHNPVMQEECHWGSLECCQGTLKAMPNIDYVILHPQAYCRIQEPLYLNDYHKDNVWIIICFIPFFFKTFFFLFCHSVWNIWAPKMWEGNKEHNCGD